MYMWLVPAFADRLTGFGTTVTPAAWALGCGTIQAKPVVKANNKTIIRRRDIAFSKLKGDEKGSLHHE